MKTNNKKKTKKQKSKKRPIVKNKKERILVIAQEFKFAKLLSSNEKKTRDRVLKALKKWLLNCFEKGYEFKEDDFFRVWKGLFYAVWMSDKPLIQVHQLFSDIERQLNLASPFFVQLSNNVYPLRVKDTDFLADVEEAVLPKPVEAAKQLKDLEKRLATSADELALRGLSRKHRKRLLAKSRAGLSIVEDVVKPDEVPMESTNGDETNSDDKQKKENNTSNKKSANKKRPNKKRKLEEQTNKVENVKKVKIDKKDQQTQKQSDIKMTTAKLNGESKTKQKLNKDNIKKIEVDKNKETSKDKTQIAVPKKKGPLVNKDNSKNNAKATIISEKKNTQAQKVKEIPSEKPIKATLVVNKVKNNKNKISPKGTKSINAKLSLNTPKKVKFVLKNNGAQAPVDYYKSVKQSPNIPFDSSKQPIKTNLKPSTPSPINPFFKKKLRLGKI
ncbi:Ribosomal RNA processing protein 1-like [Papilio machaon]|uniref:Ribosomal RNA processing protein 1-like n=1 Tax=Papilio machaon TaxID=76193 RepID=A0A194RIV1_PAPMA|nr:Ribosomal RNA processing protein 1-like [Papilio machaon]